MLHEMFLLLEHTPRLHPPPLLCIASLEEEEETSLATRLLYSVFPISFLITTATSDVLLSTMCRDFLIHFNLYNRLTNVR